MSEEKPLISYKSPKNTIKINQNQNNFTLDEALAEFEELRKIALNCFDKNGNPNILAALRAVENKAKIAGLYGKSNVQIGQITQMSEIKIDGEQLKLNIGEDFKE